MNSEGQNEITDAKGAQKQKNPWNREEKKKEMETGIWIVTKTKGSNSLSPRVSINVGL